MAADEHPKPQVTIEALAKLPAVFKKGKLGISTLDPVVRSPPEAIVSFDIVSVG